MRFPFLFRVDWLSYVIGFISGILAVALLSIARILVPKLRSNIKQRVQEARQELTKSTDDRLRKDTIRVAQRMHLASPLFTLDEIIVTPRLLAPPPVIVPGSGLLEDDVPGIPLPYTPDWPELGSNYHAQTLSIPQALSRGSNLALMGNAGSGKTVALAYLATMIARQDESAGELIRSIPILVHASNFLSYLSKAGSENKFDPLEIMNEVVSKYASILTLPRLPGVIKLAFESGSAILLFDGLDELPSEQAELVTQYLGKLLDQYPKVQAVAAVSPDCCTALLTLGFVPSALASWEDRQKEAFLKNWGELWGRYVAPGIQQGPGEIDPILLTTWLSQHDSFVTPLEITLKTWAAFAGDSLGTGLGDVIEAYVRRAAVDIPDGEYYLEKIASQMTLTMNPYVTIKEVEAWLPELSVLSTEDTLTPENPQDDHLASAQESPISESEDKLEVSSDSNDSQIAIPEAAPSSQKQSLRKVSAAQKVINDLTANGILALQSGDRITFSHLMITGYLAGKMFTKEHDLSCLESQPNWSLKKIALMFMAANLDLTDYVAPILSMNNDPLRRDLLGLGPWLRGVQVSARWRSALLRELAGVVQNEELPVGLRARAVTALVSSGDTGVMALFKQLFSSRLENVRWLAVLGCGLMSEPKLVNDLIQMTNDSSTKVGEAAVFALAAIGNRPALDTLTNILLEGSEELRRATAQAFAYLPEEGYSILKEGSSVDDLMVRRAVVYGLAKVDESWAQEILNKMQVEDGQWAVRSAATQALEEKNRLEVYIPQKLPKLTETPWLIEFAAKKGVGVLPGKPAANLLVQALKSEDIYEQVAAIGYLSRMPEINAVSDLYELMNNSYGEIREEAYNAIWQLTSAVSKN